MSDTKFTPGPWVAIDHGVGELVVYEPATDDCICSFDDTDTHYSWKPNYSTGSESVANANLIAAAPDLYEALDELVEQLEGEYFNFSSARDALAKARGQK